MSKCGPCIYVRACMCVFVCVCGTKMTKFRRMCVITIHTHTDIYTDMYVRIHFFTQKHLNNIVRYNIIYDIIVILLWY